MPSIHMHMHIVNVVSCFLDNLEVYMHTTHPINSGSEMRMRIVALKSLLSRMAFLVISTFAVTCFSIAAEPSFRTPATLHARQGADLLRRAQHAVTNLYAACGRHDRVGVEAALTSDGVVAYTLEDSGTYLAVDADALTALCANHTEGLDSNANLTDFWIFPTAQANTVFIQYRASQSAEPSSSVRGHLVVVEMRGDRISKLRDLTAVAPAGVVLSASHRPGQALAR
jgi:hypothetical protein